MYDSTIAPRFTGIKRPLVVLGAHGFIGSHLMTLDIAHGAPLGINRSQGKCALSIRQKLRELPADPIVVHAAGSVSRTASPDEQAYLKSTTDLFEAVACVRPTATVITLGSVIENLDIHTPYALIKRRQHSLARQAADQFGLQWLHVRLHNPVGPRQARNQVAGALARQLIKALSSGQCTLKVKNIHAVRDWIDVRDACRMIVALAECSKPLNRHDEVEICTGHGQSVLSLARAILKAARTDVQIVTDDIHDTHQPEWSNNLLPLPLMGALEAIVTKAGHTNHAHDTEHLNNTNSTVVGNPTYLRQLIGEAATPRFTLAQSMQDLWQALLATYEPPQ